ncbi:MAG: RNA methyltransferase, partial [Planctomycetes bacterium]|nr:RNA methyltransferase [Planctomycetota bacterium]
MTLGPVLGKERAARIAKLSTGKGRREAGQMLLDSLPLVDEGLRCGLIEELFVLPDRHPELVARAVGEGVTCTEITEPLLRKITRVEQAPGVCAVARMPAETSWDAWRSRPRFLGVYLDEVADPGNLGAIARSAAAFGVDALWLSSGCADPWSPKALRASAGALLRVEVQTEVDLAGLVTAQGDLVVLRAVARGGQDVDPSAGDTRRLLWLGNEAHGPREVPAGLQATDVTIRL